MLRMHWETLRETHFFFLSLRMLNLILFNLIRLSGSLIDDI